MAIIDNANYETYITFSGDADEVKKFKETVIDKGFFNFSSLLKVPKEIAEHPMIENGCYNALMLMALNYDPNIEYLGNIRQKMSKDNFYKKIVKPFEVTGIKYKSYSEEEFINTMVHKIHSTDSEPTIEDAITSLVKKASGHEDEARDALKRMRTYGCATRYAWRMQNWGTPMEATGCQVRPEAAKVAPYEDDAVMVYTSGGNGQKIFEFMAKKYSKLSFDIIWRRIENDKARKDETVAGERLLWMGGKCHSAKQYYYEEAKCGGGEKELIETMNEIKKTFREGWDKE